MLKMIQVAPLTNIMTMPLPPSKHDEQKVYVRVWKGHKKIDLLK